MERPAGRAFDICLAAAALCISWFLWLPVALAIKLTSPGPVIFRGNRVGLNGEPFTMYKFRTMRTLQSGSGMAVTAAGDPRITPVGRVLRAAKLDELPQFVNVLRGEMSMVGPRPEAPEFVALYTADQSAVLRVKPGITGPAQLVFRNEEQVLRVPDPDQYYRTVLMPLKIDADLAYIRSRTVRSDLACIGKTIVRIFQRG